MVTSYPHQIQDTLQAEDGVGAIVVRIRWARPPSLLWCARTRFLLQFERSPHVFEKCVSCGRESPGRTIREHATECDEIMKVVEDVTFLPESINGKARELDWLKNMGDWMISKKRFWGLALPIWVDEANRRFRGHRLATKN